ncbi:ABC transporter permease [Altericroceibacterium endophyticum]|uniref:FtsX-like permease family protein n=1 Tax=Altericroceibacterium endophyticum TaxID=1808508 RepID=A0A6I4T1Z4_9SPHN|nr:FtsX-like permease family protein [Altericroceibacterium endophyticum]MXO64926.1 FtsX-like permease family protein [Altericroceibacterium endophyticum]
MNTLSWKSCWRIARRDLHGRFRGLRLLLICLFLGVGALAAIGSLTSAISGELSSQGRAILGGDLEVEVWQRPLTDDETAFLDQYGTLSPGLRLQAMARTDQNAAPVELKAVAQNWPLYGKFTLADGRSAGAPAPGTAWVADSVAERLSLNTGDTFRVGSQTLTIAGIIGEEPDRLSEGFTLGASVIVPRDMPEKAGLTAPGALYESKTRIAFDGARDADAVQQAIEQRFPDAGFDIRTAARASPGADRFVSRMGEFLILVGLSALVIAGIGIGGGVASYLDAKRNSIATLKILGATSGDITRIYGLQLSVAAAIGAVAGMAAGFGVTPLFARALSSLLPVQGGLVFDPVALLRAAAFGALVAVAFAAPPLARARRIPAMALMRARVAPLAGDWKLAGLPVVAALIGIVALAVIGSDQPLLSGGFLLGSAVLLGLLALLGLGIRKLAARITPPRNPLWRAGLANLHRPGAATAALVTALGFGLSAFTLLAGVQTSLDANIARSVPERAPDYFVLDIPRGETDKFESIVRQSAPEATIRTVPTLRGAILAYGPDDDMTRVSDLDELPDGAWALRGERGLTYASDVPEGNSVVRGEWWPRDYDGPPLVSVDEDLAEAIGLQIGDRLTIGLLGVEREARVANFRRIDWDSLGFNYVLVFSPNMLADAPHNLAATVDFGDKEPQGPLLRNLVEAFPSSSVIEIGPILEEARVILDQVSVAVLAAASVAVLAGIAVLLGALAASRAARLYDTVILRVLGASRRQLLTMQIIEYGVLTLLLSAVALLVGTALAWAVITQLFDFDWLPDWPRILMVLGGGAALVLTFALGATLPLLRVRPARALRDL